MPLKIDKCYHSRYTDTYKITGFTESELSELNSMTYKEMIEKILEVLNSRNGNIGTCWHNGYGVRQMWISNGSVYAEVGNTCD